MVFWHDSGLNGHSGVARYKFSGAELLKSGLAAGHIHESHYIWAFIGIEIVALWFALNGLQDTGFHGLYIAGVAPDHGP